MKLDRCVQESSAKRVAKMVRTTWSILCFIAALTGGAGARSLGIDPNTHRPALRVPLREDTTADTFKRLPYQELADQIHIELAADALFDFDKGEIRSSAADYFQQAANLIFEEARGPVRIECHSDRVPAVVGQKLAMRCANAVAQWLIVQENLSKIKFTTVGTSVPPAATARNLDNPLAPKPDTRPRVTIVFDKK
jgi:outer membrane protein OmpA-like peptidoglycan-associated protein